MTRQWLAVIGLSAAFLSAGTSAARQQVPSKTRSVEGIVLDRVTDQPLANARIRLLSGESAVTGSDGRFQLAIPIQYIGYLIEVIRDGYTSPRVEGLGSAHNLNVSVSDKPGKLVIRMVREGTIAGRIIQSNGNPIVSAHVTTCRAAYSDQGSRVCNFGRLGQGSSETDDRGEFRLFGLPPGEYYVSVNPASAEMTLVEAASVSGFLSVKGNLSKDISEWLIVNVYSGEATNLGTIALATAKSPMPLTLPSAPVRLRLVNPGGELPTRATVYVDASSEAGKSYVVSKGAIDLPAMEAGFHQVGVRWGNRDGRSFYGETMIRSAGEPLDAQVTVKPAVRLNGRVSIEGTDGVTRPLSQVQVTFQPDRVVGPSLKATSGKDGSFTVYPAPPWHYKMQISGFAPGVFVISQRASDEDIYDYGFFASRDMTIEILTGTSSGRVEGVVSNLKGGPASDAVVALVPDGSGRSVGTLYRKVDTGIDGRFTILSVPPGLYHLFSWSELPGAAYRNAEFMMPYEDKGTAVRVVAGATLKVDLQLLSDSSTK